MAKRIIYTLLLTTLIKFSEAQQSFADSLNHAIATTQNDTLRLILYDIVKAHGGEIKVETKEGEGSEFIIQLPGN
jgi:signal transduction histidine kinase